MKFQNLRAGLFSLVLMLAIPALAQQPAAPPAAAPPAIEMQPPAAPPTIEMQAPPIDASLDKTWVTVTVGDLQGFLDSFGALAGKVAPQADAASLRAMLGMMTGDPALSGFTKGKGLAFLLFPPSDMVILVEGETAALEKYAQSLQAPGRVMATAPGFLIMAEDQRGVDAARKVVGDVSAKLLTGARAARMDVTVHLSRILSLYDPMITASLQSLPMMIAQQQQRGAGAQGPEAMAKAQMMGKLLELEMRVGYSLVKQVEALEISLEFTPAGAMAAMTARPLAGTNLAAFAAAKAAAMPAGLTGLVPARGGLRMTMAQDPTAMFEMLKKEIDPVLAQVALPGVNSEALLQLFNRWSTMSGDGIAIDMMLPDKPLLSGTMAATVKDAEAMLTMLENMQKDMEASGLVKFYADMGMPMTMEFTRNVGEHAGVAIHQFRFNQDFANMPPQQAAMMKEMVGEMKYDLAAVGNTVVYAMGTESIEEMIDAAKAGGHIAAADLAAQGALPAGGQAYVDFTPASLLGMLQMAMAQAGAGRQGQMLKSVSDALAGAPPLSMALYLGGGRLGGNALVPTAFFEKVGAAREMMQQQQRGPAGQPGGPAMGGQPGMGGGPAAPGQPKAARPPKTQPQKAQP